MQQARITGFVTGLALVVTSLAITDLWANPADLPAGAEKITDRYLTAVEQSQSKYSDEVRVHFNTYIKELEGLQTTETKAGRLEVATAVRDEIKRLQEEGPPVFGEAPPASLRMATARMAGTWHMTATSGVTRTYVVDNTGKVRFVDEKRQGQLKGKPTEMTVDYGDGKIERWSYCDGRLFVEHWDPKGNYPGKPATLVSVGTRIKR